MKIEKSKYFQKKTYQIECGNVRGFVEAKDEHSAFRKLMRSLKTSKKEWGVLARFREVIIGHGFKVFKVKGREGWWNYQKPYFLLKK